ncbi:MAG: hypothetical protein RIT43_1108 [Bacteroidota bacterium]|jgi:antitoxin component YwqK of YwqJK toxin-antitoxin module
MKIVKCVPTSYFGLPKINIPKMKTLIAIIFLFFLNDSTCQIISSSFLLIDNNTITLAGGNPYSGQAVEYFKSGQLKSMYSVKDGILEGRYETFYLDENFKKTNFIDTSLIRINEIEISRLKNEIKKSEYDSAKVMLEINDYINYKIGGQKDLQNLKDKNAKGKLNDKKKVLYDEYVTKELTMSMLVSEKKKLKTEMERLENQIIEERKKPIYIGNRECLFEYKNGLRNGNFKKFSSKGVIIEEGIYSDDLQNGEWKYYHPNGTLKAVGSFKSGNGGDPSRIDVPRNGREGKWMTYKENGKQDQESNWMNGLQNGTQSVYFENGKLSEISNWKNGLLHGSIIRYSENGNITEELSYFEGKYNGVWKTYHSNGNLNQIKNFKSGKMDGETMSYFESGKIKAQEIYRNDKKNGVSKEYFENGKIKAELHYVNGQMHGPGKVYHENGQVQYKFSCDSTSLQENKFFGDLYEYDEKGNLKAHGYIDINGVVTNKMEAKSSVNLSTAELKKSYRCKCCKKTINGLRDGVDRDGGEYLDMMAELWIRNKTFLELAGYNNAYDYLRNEIYKYCTMKCARVCYE